MERAGVLGAVAEASGDEYTLIELRGVELATRFSRGEYDAGVAQADALAAAARALGSTENVVQAFAFAAASLSVDAPHRACVLLAELEQVEGARESPYYMRQLPRMLRTALGAGDPTLAERLASGFVPRYPLDEHALCAAGAQLAEHRGDFGDAATLYGEAATRWQEFGNVPERAYALLGQGRCLRRLGAPEPERPLREARELFASMGYTPALAETEALLGESEAAAV